MRLARKGDSYPEKPFSRHRLQELLSQFEVTDYTKAIVSDPGRYEATDILPLGSVKLGIARLMLRFAPFFFPGFVYVLKKRRLTD
jgi:hypothetical protein